MNLSVEIASVKFKNPVIAASGTFGFGEEFAQFYDLANLGGISHKGLTLERRGGNECPRIAETASGMLNSIGLQNPGIDGFLNKEWLRLKDIDTVSIANIAGNTIEDYVEIAKKLRGSGVHMIEMNISCPNVKCGGVQFGTDPELVEEITRSVAQVCEQPLIVKLTPNVTDITKTALAAERGGADAISLINTLTGMAIDARTRRPILANVIGGLSGPAIKPVALRMTHQVAQCVNIPIIGMGGIMSGQDAIEFLICGASAVMVGTANIADPMAGMRIISEIQDFMREDGVEDIREYIGALKGCTQ